MATATADDATVNLVDLGLTEVPPGQQQLAARCTTLNLSENRLAAPAGLEAFSRVHTLVLDKNGLRSCAGFPRMPAVSTLWFNNNEISDVVSFLDEVARAWPNVAYLSTMRNPCSPPLVCVSEEDAHAMRRYRLYVVFRLPRLQFLDSSPVSEAERKEAAEKGAYLAPRRPKAAPAATAAAAALPGSAYGLSSSSGGGGGGEGEEARKKPASYLGQGTSNYDGRNSEGNRFITDRNL